MQIDLFAGDRGALRPLFDLADDSAAQIADYWQRGEILVARQQGEIVGQLLILDAASGEAAEIKSLAVAEPHRSRGVGGRLIAAALAHATAQGARRVTVAAAAAATDTLRFYQRRGFRMRRIVRDAFSAQTGYPSGLSIDGVPLRDQVLLDIDLGA